MSYGGYGQSNWKLKADKQSENGASQGSAVQNVDVQRDSGSAKASYDAKERKVVYPAQLNVKYRGQFVGRGWRRQTQYGACLTLQLEQAVPAGGKLLVVPRRQFPDSLGRT